MGKTTEEVKYYDKGTYKGWYVGRYYQFRGPKDSNGRLPHPPRIRLIRPTIQPTPNIGMKKWLLPTNFSKDEE